MQQETTSAKDRDSKGGFVRGRRNEAGDKGDVRAQKSCNMMAWRLEQKMTRQAAIIEQLQIRIFRVDRVCAANDGQLAGCHMR
jgi:hypothetical protein